MYPVDSPVILKFDRLPSQPVNAVRCSYDQTEIILYIRYYFRARTSMNQGSTPTL